MKTDGIELQKARETLGKMIEAEGRWLPNNILLVDRFLNQQINIDLYEQIGRAFAEVFADCGVTKVLTIEASGIALAFVTAQTMGVPAVFAKKQIPLNIGKDYLESQVYSYTKQKHSPLSLSSYLLDPSDRILIVDDFLARGEALKGLIRLCRKGGAEVVGVGIAIEKTFQGGRLGLAEQNIPLCSLYEIEQAEN